MWSWFLKKHINQTSHTLLSFINMQGAERHISCQFPQKFSKRKPPNLESPTLFEPKNLNLPSKISNFGSAQACIHLYPRSNRYAALPAEDLSFLENHVRNVGMGWRLTFLVLRVVESQTSQSYLEFRPSNFHRCWNLTSICSIVQKTFHRTCLDKTNFTSQPLLHMAKTARKRERHACCFQCFLRLSDSHILPELHHQSVGNRYSYPKQHRSRRRIHCLGRMSLKRDFRSKTRKAEAITVIGSGLILLMEEIQNNHLGWKKTCKDL